MAEPTSPPDGSPEAAQPHTVTGSGGAGTDRPAPARAANVPEPDAGAPAAGSREETPDSAPGSSRDDQVTARADEDRAAVPGAAEGSLADGDRTVVLPPAAGAAPADAGRRPASLPPAEAPPPPRLYSNRLVGTAWVLLAALCFEVLYLAAFALVVLVVAGPANVPLSMQQSLIATPFVWLPVVLFALFYELTVLLLNRAGRFAYVLTSLIVAAIVYVLSAVLILAMQDGGISNEGNLGRALIAPQVVLIPLVAREVMLWTGLAVGARGRRVRRRNEAAQAAYERERFASSVRGSDDGAGAGA